MSVWLVSFTPERRAWDITCHIDSVVNDRQPSEKLKAYVNERFGQTNAAALAFQGTYAKYIQWDDRKDAPA